MGSHLQAVESFHLQFARLLCAGPDKDCFAIKGGCNLRFFFESVRYSEEIEFSRRSTTEEAVLEPIAPSVVAEHQSMQFLAPHYPLGAALRQKVKALADRRVVQARDVFDLGGVLIPRTGGRVDLLGPVRADIQAAMERAMTLSYADYKAQVVSYLQPEQAGAHGSPEAWDALQTQVVEYLDKALASAGGVEP